jgi:hypothetical protein
MKDGASNERSSWEAMTLRDVGRLADIVAGGGGKLSIVANDTGDAPRKPRGLEK